MTRAFFLQLSAWTPPRLEQELAPLLAPDERERRDRFRRAEDAARFTLARGALRCLLGSELDRDACGLRFVKGAHGKPRLDDGGGGASFNVSHAGDWVLIGIGHGGSDLGVDVERAQPAKDFLPLAERFFTRREHAALAATQTGEERTAAFFRLWTRKEACAKASGEGLPATLDGCEALPLTPWHPAEGVTLGNGRWRVWDLPAPGPDYAAALALEGTDVEGTPPVCHWLLPGDLP